jgi:hypothetical protein
VRDWSDGRIDGAYPVSCYRTALAKLPEDLRVYSNAPDDITAALQQKLARTHRSRGLAVAGKPRATDASIHTAQSTSLDRPTVLAAALGTFGLTLAAAGALGALARRRWQSR